MDEKTWLMHGLKISGEEGTVHLGDERILLSSSAVFGALRKDLAENLGHERMKGFLLRYGWNLGAEDAKKVIKRGGRTVEEMLRRGPIFHRLRGYAKAKTMVFQIEYDDAGQQVDAVHVEGVWHRSYEAEENLRLNGCEEEPVCFTLVGYASGYYSTICGHTVIFKEVSCIGAGHQQCRYVGKSLHLWNGEADEELRHYDNRTIIKELENTYQELLEERNRLAKTWMIHEKLTEEVINGNDLLSIASAVFETTGIPIVIEDINFRELAQAGLRPEQLENVTSDFERVFLRNRPQGTRPFPFTRTKEMRAEKHRRLMTPIRLQNRIFGYCSFIYDVGDAAIPKIDWMVLERVAVVCSLYLLNEKTSFETMERMKGYFLEQILSGQFSTKKEIIKRGRYLHVELEQPFYVVVISYHNPLDHVDEMFFHEQLLEVIFLFFKEMNANALIGQRDGNIILFVQERILKEQTDIKPFCQDLLRHLSRSFPAARFRGGVSTKGHHIEQAREHYLEALIALKIAAMEHEGEVVLFDEIGVSGILISSQNTEAVKRKAHYLLHPLYKNEHEYDKELLKTLYIFLLNGGNLQKTARQLSISFSGLRYRMDKIGYLLQKDLRHPSVHHELLLTLKALIAGGVLSLD